MKKEKNQELDLKIEYLERKVKRLEKLLFGTLDELLDYMRNHDREHKELEEKICDKKKYEKRS